MITLLSSKVDTYQKQATEEVKKNERSWADIASAGKLSEDLKKTLQVTSNTQALLSKDLEKKDAESRKNNAILYGLPESRNAMEDIRELMKKEMFKHFDAPQKASRLGAKGRQCSPSQVTIC